RSSAGGLPPAGGPTVGAAEPDTASTTRAALGGGKAYFAGVYLPLHINQPIFQVGTDIGLPIETPFAVFHDFYTGECVKDDRGKSYLELAVEPGPGDVRQNPVPFDHTLFRPDLLGPHVVDYNCGIGDMIDLVQQKAAALKAAQQAASGA